MLLFKVVLFFFESVAVAECSSYFKLDGFMILPILRRLQGRI